MALRDILPSAVIDTVEIDEAVVRVAKRFFDFAEDDQNRVYVQDARVFGKRAALRGEQYDLIILDAFDGEYIPEHLMTIEFLGEMRTCSATMGCWSPIPLPAASSTTMNRRPMPKHLVIS